MPEALNYHDSIDEFRRDLMIAFANHQSFADNAVGGAPTVMVAVTASNLYYTLAAVLGLVQKECDPEVAQRIAVKAEDVFVNGDSWGLNEDVR